MLLNTHEEDSFFFNYILKPPVLVLKHKLIFASLQMFKLPPVLFLSIREVTKFDLWSVIKEKGNLVFLTLIQTLYNELIIQTDKWLQIQIKHGNHFKA